MVTVLGTLLLLVFLVFLYTLGVGLIPLQRGRWTPRGVLRPDGVTLHPWYLQQALALSAPSPATPEASPDAP
jgi:hypothetical protein